MLKIIKFRDRFSYTAKSDIKCFKVLERKSDDNVAYSPYQQHPFTLKHEETAILTCKFFPGEVEHGIHAFLNLSDAQKLANELIEDDLRRKTFKYIIPNQNYSVRMWNWLLSNYKKEVTEVWKKMTPARFEVFECVVPQGAKYYKGVWNSKYPSKLIPNIAASKLTVLRGINDPVPLEEWIEPEQAKVEVTVEQSVEERLSAIIASVEAIPASQETMEQSVTHTVNKIK